MKVFRPAPPRSTAANLARTLGQTTLFWAVFVVAAPYGMHALERALAVPGFSFPHQRLVALVGFVAMAALNLGSGVTMAVVGRGTPFPADTARELVVRGPYRHVRNPMALGGLGVGASVGVALGSWVILGYVVLGGLAWHAIARPMEERDLEARFGASYVAYRGAVRNWLPRWTPY